MNRGLVTTGAVLLGIAVVVPALFFTVGGIQGDHGDGMGAFGSVVMGFMFMGILSPVLGITGIVLLIVGATTGGQQQQQQVVVYSQGTQRVCSRCGAAVGPGTRYCGSCGAPA